MRSGLFSVKIVRWIGSLWLIGWLIGLAACSAAPASPVASPRPVTAASYSIAPSSAPPTQSPPPSLDFTRSPLAVTPTASQTLSPTPTAAPFRLPAPPEKRAQYQLQATLDYAGHSLAVDETIVYTNTTPDRLESLVLVIEALRFPGSFRLVSLTDGGGARLTQRWLKDIGLSVSLPEPLAPGDSLQLVLSYTLRLLDVQKLAQVRPYPLGYSSVQTYLGDWYPFIPPYQPGTGWIAHPPATYGERLVYDIADFDVRVRFAAGENNLLIAASAPAVQDGEWRRFIHLAARSFAWSVSPYYQVASQEVQLDAGHRALVASYYFPAHAEAGKSLLETMAQALTLYSRLWGAYPHPTFTGVQADFLDGMEYDGLFFLSADFYNWHKPGAQDFLVALAAHETAHQWWYSLIGNDQAMQPWLDEALCTYSEFLFYENTYPQALEWWWTYRIHYYEPQGWVDISVYDAPNVAGQYQLYRNPVYLRGAQFLDELRQVTGDAAFFASLRAYAARFAYRQADAAGFFEIVRQHTTEDLSAVLSKYFSKTVD